VPSTIGVRRSDEKAMKFHRGETPDSCEQCLFQEPHPSLASEPGMDEEHFERTTLVHERAPRRFLPTFVFERASYSDGCSASSPSVQVHPSKPHFGGVRGSEPDRPSVNPERTGCHASARPRQKPR
jgi:hypothetical protein